jgi:hypothetical protein
MRIAWDDEHGTYTSDLPKTVSQYTITFWNIDNIDLTVNSRIDSAEIPARSWKMQLLNRWFSRDLRNTRASTHQPSSTTVFPAYQPLSHVDNSRPRPGRPVPLRNFEPTAHIFLKANDTASTGLASAYWIIGATAFIFAVVEFVIRGRALQSVLRIGLFAANQIALSLHFYNLLHQERDRGQEEIKTRAYRQKPVESHVEHEMEGVIPHRRYHFT